MAYATLNEFVRVMRLDSPTQAALDAAQRCLDASTQEIDAYLGWQASPPALTTEQEALVVTVNIDRAAEHWRLTPYGALSQGPDTVPLLTARNSWYRHAQNLASLKSWDATVPASGWGVG